MKRIQKIASIFLLTCFAAIAFGDHEVGNPGDPVRLLLSEAVDDARVILIRVPPNLLDTAYPEVQTWYEDNYELLQDILANARYKWEDQERGACAFANHEELRIYFFFQKCSESVTNKAEAIKLIIHENGHLAGLNQTNGKPDEWNELVADRLANSIYRTWLNLDINTTPRWEDFNPNDMPGERAAHASVSFKDAAGDRRLFVWGGCNENDRVALPCSTYVGDGGIYNIDQDSWEKVEPIPAYLLSDPFEGKRAYSTAVYTGNTGDAAGKILIFGGCSGPANICINDYESVLEYQLNTKTWSVKHSAKAPIGRSQHHAQMTSKGMLIWGGISDRAQSGRGNSLNSGAVYDPKTEDWTEMPTHDAPSPRRFATAVWTGTENPTLSNDEKLIVFGGCDEQKGEYCPTTYEDGGVFDLDSFTWRKIKKSPFRARARHTAVWTGESMFVWGGLKGSTTLIDGALFTFTWDQDSRSLNETWNIVSSIVPEGRYDHSAVWAGDRVLIWGGVKSIGEYAYGMREYHLPSARRPRGTWRTPITAAAPVGRKLHSAHWIDDSFFVWGGTSLKRSYLYSGGRFFPKVSP